MDGPAVPKFALSSTGEGLPERMVDVPERMVDVLLNQHFVSMDDGRCKELSPGDRRFSHFGHSPRITIRNRI